MPDSEPAVQIADALQQGAFDPQHAGELFLRADAEQAIRATLGGGARVAVAGREDSDIRPVAFMGARFAPDLVVDVGGKRIAVTITLLRNDSSSMAHTLAGAL